jgi:hypothetical protein
MQQFIKLPLISALINEGIIKFKAADRHAGEQQGNH